MGLWEFLKGKPPVDFTNAGTGSPTQGQGQAQAPKKHDNAPSAMSILGVPFRRAHAWITQPPAQLPFMATEDRPGHIHLTDIVRLKDIYGNVTDVVAEFSRLEGPDIPPEKITNDTTYLTDTEIDAIIDNIDAVVEQQGDQPSQKQRIQRSLLKEALNGIVADKRLCRIHTSAHNFDPQIVNNTIQRDGIDHSGPM